jgi:hypothetical protein
MGADRANPVESRNNLPKKNRKEQNLNDILSSLFRPKLINLIPDFLWCAELHLNETVQGSDWDDHRARDGRDSTPSSRLHQSMSK